MHGLLLKEHVFDTLVHGYHLCILVVDPKLKILKERARFTTINFTILVNPTTLDPPDFFHVENANLVITAIVPTCLQVLRGEEALGLTKWPTAARDMDGACLRCMAVPIEGNRFFFMYADSVAEADKWTSHINAAVRARRSSS